MGKIKIVKKHKPFEVNAELDDTVLICETSKGTVMLDCELPAGELVGLADVADEPLEMLKLGQRLALNDTSREVMKLLPMSQLSQLFALWGEAVTLLSGVEQELAAVGE